MRVSIGQRCIAIIVVLVCFCFAGTAFALSPLQDTALREGSQGRAVLNLQMNLSELGLYSEEPDGGYGAQTAEAVRVLQTRLGVAANGTLNRQTIAAYNAQLKEGTLKTQSKLLAGLRIGIDPGHQKKADMKTETVLSGTNRTKERMSAGTVGIKTKSQEYEIVLQVANYLKAYLEGAGAEVVMTRTKSDVSVSNMERAELMNKANVDFWVRLHCDYSNTKETQGAHALCPNKTVKPDIADNSLLLSRAILVAFCKETDAKQLSILLREDQTGFNWSNSPVTTIEMGYLSNIEEDMKLNKAAYQQSCAKGIYKGIVSYADTVQAMYETDKSIAE